MLGQEGLLHPGMKSPSTPLHSPTRGQLFLSDHHSDNSNDPAVTSDQEDDDDNVRSDPRIDLIDHRGDPRDELRAAEEAENRAPVSPTGPLSLTTNDKGNSKTSPKSSMEVSQDREISPVFCCVKFAAGDVEAGRLAFRIFSRLLFMVMALKIQTSASGT